MKFFIGMMLLVMANGAFAACSLTSLGECKKEDCDKLNTSGQPAVVAWDGACKTVAASQSASMPDCAVVNGDSGPKPTGGSATAPAAAGKDGVSK